MRFKIGTEQDTYVIREVCENAMDWHMSVYNAIIDRYQEEAKSMLLAGREPDWVDYYRWIDGGCWFLPNNRQKPDMDDMAGWMVYSRYFTNHPTDREREGFHRATSEEIYRMRLVYHINSSQTRHSLQDYLGEVKAELRRVKIDRLLNLTENEVQADV